MRVTLPPQLVEHARAFADGSQTPAEPRDAATVVLMRPGSAGPEVYLLRRQTSMAFAGGMCVFPGGGVDPRDFDRSVAWAGPSAAEWARGLTTTEEMARALVCAAVRETFEESGVLLAATSSGDVVADTTGDSWEADRRALEAKELAFTDVPRAARPGAAHRPARRVVGLVHAGLRAPALPDLVLRRRSARRVSARATSRPSRRR